jgi:GT2 family glycosyltransferase
MAEKILFSVVIPTYHRNDLLAKCLNCLSPDVQTLPADRYEVVVTDDGSQTTAEAMIQEKYPRVKWVAGPRKGPAANRNNGAKFAQGEWLVFTDDDCLPDPQWLEAYEGAIANNPSCLVFEGRTYVDRPRQSLAEKSPVNEIGGYLWSCNFAIQRHLFESLEGFDERFPYAAMEDVDLSLRIIQAGYKILFIQQAAIFHPWRISGGWFELKRHQKSTFIYLSLHPEERIRINSAYYLNYTFRVLFKDTIPNLLKLKGHGAKAALLEHLAFLQMTFLLLFSNNSFYSKHQQ